MIFNFKIAFTTLPGPTLKSVNKQSLVVIKVI